MYKQAVTSSLGKGSISAITIIKFLGPQPPASILLVIYLGQEDIFVLIHRLHRGQPQ